jgi:20S proteasome alpha/beta subunit
MELDSHKLLAGAGVAADCVNFSEFIQKNLKLYELNNDCKLNTKAAANFIRGEVDDGNHKIYASYKLTGCYCFTAGHCFEKRPIPDQRDPRRP